MRAAQITALLILALARNASADAVTSAINDLQTSTSYRVRVSAGAQLARLGDPRGIAVLAYALLHDQEASVREVAAIAIGKLVTSASSAADLQLALHALDRASQVDSDRHVRHGAQRVHDKLVALSAPPKAGTYIEVAQVSAPNRPAGIASRVSRRIAKLINKQPGFQTTTPGKGYEIHATVTSLTASASGRTFDVECAITMVLRDHPATRMLATFTAHASVVAASRADVVSAGEDCVDALSGAEVNQVFPLIAKLPVVVTATSASSTTGMGSTTGASSTTSGSATGTSSTAGASSGSEQ